MAMEALSVKASPDPSRGWSRGKIFQGVFILQVLKK